MTEVYEVRGRRIGVRWSRAGLDGDLRALATSALGIQDAPPNISIVLGERAGRTRSKHQLHVQGQLSSVISGESGLVRAVIRALGALAAEPPPGSLSLNAFLVVDQDGTAIAVDRRLAADVRRLEATIRRHGQRVLQLARLDVWPDRDTATLPDAAAATGISLDALDDRWPAQPGDDDLSAGEVAVRRLIYAGRPVAESRGHAIANMVPMLRGPKGLVDRATVAQLAAFTADIELSGAPMQDRSRLAALLGVT